MLFLSQSKTLSHSIRPVQWLTTVRTIATGSANGTMAAAAGEAAEATCSTAAVRIRREIWAVRNTRKSVLECFLLFSN